MNLCNSKVSYDKDKPTQWYMICRNLKMYRFVCNDSKIKYRGKHTVVLLISDTHTAVKVILAKCAWVYVYWYARQNILRENTSVAYTTILM